MNTARVRSAPGQILPLFAGSLLVLILVVGLVIDGGNVFLQRRDAQNGADIGAMAGTKRLADYYVKGSAFTAGNNVYSAVSTRMTENNCAGGTSGCTWAARYVGPRTGASFVDLGPVSAGDTAPPTVSGQQALGVKVNVNRTPRTFLLGIIGQSSWDVNTTATALAQEPVGAPAGQLLPIGLTQLPTQEGAVYALTSGSNGPGNFGWVSWDGSNNAGSLATSLCTPDNPAFTLPFQFAGDPGKTNATDVRACLQQWVDNQQTVLIPIVLASNDPSAPAGCSTGANGNNFHYCVVAIAAFVITGYAQPAVDQINGRFIGTVPYSVGGSATVPAGTVKPPSPNSTLYYMGLSQ
ncbi:MAG: hypothetical protein H0U52_13335 [Chloroflexi bacterium]|nr:hypothetical protein [Chloroflexota bacterium]